MKITDLLKDDSEKIRQTAVLLHESFEAWPTMELAINEVRESLNEDRISRILLNDDGEVVGWIGGNSQYNGKVWELHPLVIHKAYRNKGLGKQLVLDFEKQVALRGGITILLGTDDEYDQTSLSNKNLYDDVPSAIHHFQGKTTLRISIGS